MSNFMKNVNHDLPVEEGFRDWPKAMITKAKHFLTSKSLVTMDINDLNKAIFVAERAILTALDKEITKDSTSDMKQLKHALQKVSKRGIYGKEHKLIINAIANPKDPLQNIQHTIPLFVVRFTKMYPKSEWLDTSPEADRGDFSKDADDFNTLTERLRHAANEEAKKLKLEGKIVEYSGDGDWDDPGEAWFEFAFHPGDYFERNPMPSKEAAKEATQEALFQDLTGQPVEEGIVSTIGDGLALAGFVAAGLTLWGIPIYLGYKAINKLSDKWEKDRMHKQHKAIEDKEKLIKKEAENSPFYDERSAAFKEASKIISKLFVAKFKDKNWLDLDPRADYFFLAGRTNMTFLGFVPSTLKSVHGIPGEDEYIAKLKKSEKYDYDELDEDGTDYNLEPYYDEYNKFLDKLESDTNKKLSKLFGGKFGVLISDNHNIEEFASDDYDYPGFVLLVDKTRLKNGEKFIDFNNINNFLRESASEVIDESSWSAKDALLTAGGIAAIGAMGYGTYRVLKNDIEDQKKYNSDFGNSSSYQKVKMVEKYTTEFMATQKVDSQERRKAVKDAIALVKKYYPKDINQNEYGFTEDESGLGYDLNGFCNGKCNILDFGYTPSCCQCDYPYLNENILKRWDLDPAEEEKMTEKAVKKWIAALTKCENSINKDLAKKYNGRYKVFFEEIEKGGYWKYCGGGDGDEGLVIIVDVEMADKVKEYMKSKGVKESTEVVSEAEPVTEGIGVELAKTLGWVALLFGAMSYKHYKEGKKEREALEKKQEAEAKKCAKEAEDYVKKTDYLKSHPVDTKERKAVYIETLSAIDKFFDKSDIVLKGTEFGNPKVFTGEANPELPDIFCIDVGVTIAFQQMTTVWDTYSELEKSDKDKAEKYLDKEQKEWEDDLYSKLKAVNKELHKKYGSKYKLEMEPTRDYFIIYLIDIAYKAGLLNAVKEQFDLSEDGYSAVTEGWGVVFTRFAVKHSLPFAKKLEDKIWQWSETTVNKLISLPEFKSYIDREASTVFKEEVKKNKNLSLKITPDMIEKFEETYADEAQFKKTESRNCCFCQKVGLYYIGVFGDKSHIHGVWLLMSDVRNRKIFAKALPAPSEEEMKKLCFQG